MQWPRANLQEPSPTSPAAQPIPCHGHINYLWWLLCFYIFHLYLGWSPKCVSWSTESYKRASWKLALLRWDKLQPLFLPSLYLGNVSPPLILSKAKAHSQFRVYALVPSSAWNPPPLWLRSSFEFELKRALLTEGFAASSATPSPATVCFTVKAPATPVLLHKVVPRICRIICQGCRYRCKIIPKLWDRIAVSRNLY